MNDVANLQMQAGGGGAMLLLSSMLWPAGPPSSPPVLGAELGPELETRSTDYSFPGHAPAFELEDCVLFNGTLYDSASCNKLSVSRVLPATIARAEERALGCAALLETDCVFGEEVGLSLPVAFVYAPDTGVRHVIAPRLVKAGANATEKRVRMVSPVDARPVGEYTLVNSSVVVEFLERGKRGGVYLKTEEFSGRDAYCIAFLRMAYGSECWNSLD